MDHIIDEAIIQLANVRQLKKYMNKAGKAKMAIRLEEIYRQIINITLQMPKTDEVRAIRRLGFACRDACDNMFK